MLDTFLRAARASRMLYFVWSRVNRLSGTLLTQASSRAIVLASPHIPWYLLTDRADLVRLWAKATLEVPYTEEVAQSVVDTLLQIASRSKLLEHIPVGLWSWLAKRPTLPPVCSGRYFGTYQHVVMAVRERKDVEIIKSYLLIAWSEWDALWNEGFDEMCTSIREDFGEMGIGHHQEDLIQRLDHILGELDRGLEHLQQRNPILKEYDFQLMSYQYRRLRSILVKSRADIEAITRASLISALILNANSGGDTGSRATFMCALPLLSP